MRNSQTETVYELTLHDFANLSCQLLECKTEPKSLNELADKMNFIFLQSGRGEQFQAIVHRIERELGAE